MAFIRGPKSFRAKLTLSFIVISCVVVTAVGTLVTLNAVREETRDLRHKAALYATLLEAQLRPAVAFDDRITARELFESFGIDPDVRGLAVYDAQGALIAGYGVFPDTFTFAKPEEADHAGSVVAITDVSTPAGRQGRLFVDLTTRSVDAHVERSAWTTLWIAIVVLGCAAAAGNFLSKAISRQLDALSAAARRFSTGNLDQPSAMVDVDVDDEIGGLARAFNSMFDQLRRHFTEREQLAATEQTRLGELVATRTAQLEEGREQYRLVAESTNAIPFSFEPDIDCFTYVGPQAEKRLGYSLESWMQPGFLDKLVGVDGAARFRTASDFEFECSVLDAGGRSSQLRWVVSQGESKGKRCSRGLVLDMTDQRRLERELGQAQRLESVGRLASGVAHEINTPVQFVSDSVHFLRDASKDLTDVLVKLQRVQKSVLEGRSATEAANEAAAAAEAADIDYILQNIPPAFERTLDGLGRVATIVRSMKDFAHPDSSEMATIDLNRAIRSTLIIAKNEYKYVADVETDFGDLPLVMCHVGEVNQAVLNIVVNAAHAIGDVVKGTDKRGKITVRTRADGERVVIEIQDTGGGIPDALRERIFDPFFTTKEVGRGTGQGLAIARSVIVDKHKGDLTLTSEIGVGTTFRLSFSANGPAQAPASVEAA